MAKLKNTKFDTIKKELVEALRAKMGNVSEACKVVGVSRSIFYNNFNEDPEFREQVQSIEESNIDFAESQLRKLIREGNVTATLFFLKTKGRKRGYIEQVDHTTNGEAIVPSITVNIVTSPNGDNPKD